MTYSAANLPAELTIGRGTRMIAGTIDPAPDQSGPYTVAVTATDDLTSESDSQSFTWAVKAVTVSLTSPGDQSNYAGAAVNLKNAAIDYAAHVLNFSVAGLPSGLSINSNAGVISGNIASDANVDGPYSVTLTVGDSASAISVSQSFSWTVNDITLDTPDKRTAFGPRGFFGAVGFRRRLLSQGGAIGMVDADCGAEC